MKDTNIKSSSRRRTPWSEIEDASSIESFIDSCNQRNYSRRHPSPKDTGEIALINSVIISECRHCGSSDIKKIGKTSVGVQRYICRSCGKSFTALTNTIFDRGEDFHFGMD